MAHIGKTGKTGFRSALQRSGLEKNNGDDAVQAWGGVVSVVGHFNWTSAVKAQQNSSELTLADLADLVLAAI